MVKAVLFDLDGTLVNSLFDLADSTNYALEQFGFPTHETEKFKYFVGDGMPKLIERALPQDKRDEITRQKVLEVFMNHYRVHFADKTCEYKGISEVLHNLKSKGIKLAVISNKVQEMALKVVSGNFGDVFDAVYGKCEGYPAKPHPALTLKLIEELGVKPQECAFVGDSGMDMAVSQNAGCISVGVLWGFRDETELNSNGAEYIAKEPFELIEIIENI